jgi:hypothetical protein
MANISPRRGFSAPKELEKRKLFPENPKASEERVRTM